MVEKSIQDHGIAPKILFNKDFILLWMGQIVSGTGNSIQYVALMWWISERFSSAQSGVVMGWMFALNMVALAGLSPFAGTLSDRTSRKVIVVLSDTFRGFSVLWIAYLVYMNQLTVLWIYITSIIMGSGSAFFRPSLQATIPNIVPEKQLTRANGLYQTGVEISQVAGFALGGLLTGFLGLSFVLAFNGASFIVSAFTEIFINFRQSKRGEISEKNISFFGDLGEGLGSIYSEKLILWTILIASLVTFAFSPIDILFAKQVRYIYKLGASELGYVVSSFVVGMTIGTFLLSILPELKKKHNMIIFNILSAGMLFSMMGFISNFIIFLIVVLLSGINIALVSVLLTVVLQKIVPDKKRGRVFSVLETFTSLTQIFSLMIIGEISNFLANSALFLLLGTMMIIALIFAFLAPRFKTV